MAAPGYFNAGKPKLLIQYACATLVINRVQPSLSWFLLFLGWKRDRRNDLKFLGGKTCSQESLSGERWAGSQQIIHIMSRADIASQGPKVSCVLPVPMNIAERRAVALRCW